MEVSVTFRRFTMDGPARLVDRVNVYGPAGLRQSDANHAVPRHDRRKLLLRPILGAFGPHGKDHEAAFLV